MTEVVHAFLLGLTQDTTHCVETCKVRVNESSQHYDVMRVRKKRTFVEIRERGTEGETDEVVAWRVEEVTTV